MAGNAAQTSREMPAKISFLRPVPVMASATLGSSNAFTDKRSMIGTPGSASTSSGRVGPHMLSRGRGDDNRQVQRPRCLGQRDHVVLQLSRRIIPNASHEADLVVDKDERGVFGSERVVTAA